MNKNFGHRSLQVVIATSVLAFTLTFSACKEPEEFISPVQCQKADEVAAVLKTSQLSWNPSSGESLELNPDTLRVLLLNGNMTLFQAANRVHQAKGMLNLARANLLPSINLGVLIQGAASPTFLLSSVEFALPFLFPSKWFDMYAKKNLMKAEELAFLLAQLNQYSSLYALYLGIQGDYIARDFLTQDIQDALAVERLVSHSYEIGQATAADLDLASSQVLAADTRLIKLEELLAEEMASLRYALAICPEVPLTLAEHALPPSELESLTAVQAANLVMRSAPETAQMDYLIRAAELERWSKVFAFLGGGSIGGVGTSNADAFSNMNGRTQMNLGFSYAMGISLSNRSIEALRLQRIDLGSVTLKVLDSSLTRIGLIAERIDNAATSEQLLENVFDSEKRRYLIGETTLLSLTEAQGKLRQVRLDKIRADFDRKLERLSLHRLVRDEVFAPIKGCAGTSKAPDTLIQGMDPCDSEFVKRKLGEGDKIQAAPVETEAASDSFASGP